MKRITLLNIPLIFLFALTMVVYRNQGYYSGLILIDPLILIGVLTFVAVPLFVLNFYFFVISFKETKSIFERVMMIFLILSAFLMMASVPASNSIYLKVGWYSILLILFIPVLLTLVSFSWITFMSFKVKEKTIINNTKNLDEKHTS